jgi:hypothetical protein
VPGVTTYRPLGVRFIAYGAAAVILVIALVIGAAMPENIVFRGVEIGTLVVIYLAVVAVLHGIARSYVKASDEGLEIRNGYRQHMLPWSEIRGISMRAGAPWPTLIYGDDERIMMFALQGTDGPRTKQAINELVQRIP